MSKPASKPAAKKVASSGPSYESMIKEAILAHPEEARLGLSRPTIKKYVLSKYPSASKVSDATFNNHIAKAIVKGAEKKVFSLPKGPSGKVKLAAAAKKAPAAKKPAVKKVTKPAAKKATTTAKKPAAAKKTKSSTATKAKKPVAKKTGTSTKKAAPKKKAATPKKAVVAKKV